MTLGAFYVSHAIGGVSKVIGILYILCSVLVWVMVQVSPGLVCTPGN